MRDKITGPAMSGGKLVTHLRESFLCKRAKKRERQNVGGEIAKIFTTLYP